MFGDNPITKAVAVYEAKIADLDAEALARLEEAGTLDTGDWLRFGPTASEAYAGGLIDLDTANALHAIHTRFNNGASLAERVVFIQVMSEILALRLRNRGQA